MSDMFGFLIWSWQDEPSLSSGCKGTSMIRVFPAAWVVIGGLLFSSPTWAQADLGILKKGVVKVSAQFARTEKVGTGFIAGQGKKHLFIVTASHVIEGEAEVPQSIHVPFFTHQ